MTCPSHSPWSGHAHNIWREVLTTKLLGTQFSPVSCKFLLFGPKYLICAYSHTKCVVFMRSNAHRGQATSRWVPERLVCCWSRPTWRKRDVSHVTCRLQARIFGRQQFLLIRLCLLRLARFTLRVCLCGCVRADNSGCSKNRWNDTVSTYLFICNSFQHCRYIRPCSYQLIPSLWLWIKQRVVLYCIVLYCSTRHPDRTAVTVTPIITYRHNSSYDPQCHRYFTSATAVCCLTFLNYRTILHHEKNHWHSFAPVNNSTS